MTLWNHDVTACATRSGKCINHYVHKTIARVNHYRESSNEEGLEFQTMKTFDDQMWKHLKRLNTFVFDTLKNIGWNHLIQYKNYIIEIIGFGYLIFRFL